MALPSSRRGAAIALLLCVALVVPASARDLRWPVSGRVIEIFKPERPGINIELPEGTAIHAAEDGQVIYVGSGVEGYGNLILIRHPACSDLVTAYAHLKTIDVGKGAVVARGDTIGTGGMTGSVSRPQLHFETRKGATPVDPFDLLAEGASHRRGYVFTPPLPRPRPGPGQLAMVPPDMTVPEHLTACPQPVEPEPIKTEPEPIEIEPEPFVAPCEGTPARSVVDAIGRSLYRSGLPQGAMTGVGLAYACSFVRLLYYASSAEEAHRYWIGQVVRGYAYF